MKLDKYMVGRRYGKALFQAAKEKDQLPDVHNQLKELRKIYEEIPDLGNILTDARLEPYEKDEIFNTLFPSFEGLMSAFLKTVYSYHRFDAMLFIIDEFERRYDEYRGILYGTVTSVVPLTHQEQEQLQQQLTKTFQVKEVHLKNQIDEKILGGVVVEARNHVIDGSLKSKISQLQKEFM